MKTIGEVEKEFDLLHTFRFEDGQENADVVTKAARVKRFYRNAFSEILDSLVMDKLDNTKKESTSDWFYGYGYNACREELLSRINKIKEGL